MPEEGEKKEKKKKKKKGLFFPKNHIYLIS
jgi:hypothetical protein